MQNTWENTMKYHNFGVDLVVCYYKQSFLQGFYIFNEFCVSSHTEHGTLAASLQAIKPIQRLRNI